MVEDIDAWNVICESLYVPTIEVKDGDVTRFVPKT